MSRLCGLAVVVAGMLAGCCTSPESNTIAIMKKDFTILNDVTQPTFRADRSLRIRGDGQSQEVKR